MPQPFGRDNLSPEELARQLAEHLAQTSGPARRFSLRSSVLVGRLISGVLIMGTAAIAVVAVVFGANWLLDRTSRNAPEVLAIAPISNSATGYSSTTTTLGSDFLLAVVTTGGSSGSDLPTEFVGAASFLPALPAPTTTTTVPASATTSTPESAGSTAGSAPTTTRPAVTTTSTAPLPAPTLPTTTTTSTTTTTTAEATTTTVAATSTTDEATTTTCGGNNGGGSGSGPCGP
ncbi:MAG TPA: hypothetical protein VFS66_01555 [Acidimicrobiia bacterium]|nr:hypothetical protein [Acidimicrobiia bacterium]